MLRLKKSLNLENHELAIQEMLPSLLLAKLMSIIEIPIRQKFTHVVHKLKWILHENQSSTRASLASGKVPLVQRLGLSKKNLAMKFLTSSNTIETS